MASTSSPDPEQIPPGAQARTKSHEGRPASRNWLLERLDDFLSEQMRTSASPSDLVRFRVMTGAALFLLASCLSYLMTSPPRGMMIATALSALGHLTTLIVIRGATSPVVPARTLCVSLTHGLVVPLFVLGDPDGGSHPATMLLPALAVYMMGPRAGFLLTLFLAGVLGVLLPLHAMPSDVVPPEDFWVVKASLAFSYVGAWALGALHSKATDAAKDSLERTLEELARDIAARKEAEARLGEMHRTLVDVSRQAGMAEIATGVLHNVGNTLNSVNISTSMLADLLRKSRVTSLAKTTQLLREHSADFGAFFSADPQGKKLPNYLIALSESLVEEREAMSREVLALSESVDHIKSIVTMQQKHARTGGTIELVHVPQLIDEALRLHAISLERLGISVVREYTEVPSIYVDRHKLLQILINLLSNARHALVETQGQDKRLTIRVRPAPDEPKLLIEVADNGMGISPENLPRIFTQGFTTKKTGHGFGLHISALAANEMKGRLTCTSPGPGQGATFILELPMAGEEVSP
jgi:signal transduction histidine kinase